MASPRRAPTSTSPLSSTTLDVSIVDLVAEYVVLHCFENIGDLSIEAVFSFPVPLDAAFLGMQATLAGETLMAQIEPQHQASRTYGDAIAEGNSAVLLRAPEPGLLNVSLGNLKPGEKGVIELRFATALKISDRTARFSLPFVHRPRYGAWRLEDLETPTHDFLIEHPMSATIHVTGLLASAPVTCATHAARFARRGETLELGISQAMLDRDLVLHFELERSLAPTGHLIVDGDGSLGIASFVVPVRDEKPQPIDLCLLLDCSGSMLGDAIEQARAAMVAVSEAVGAKDRVQVLRFGSTIVPMFRRPLLATSRVRDALRELVPTIEADLGGTEMGKALMMAIKQFDPTESNRARAIILVTDGAVQPDDLLKAKTAARKADVRVFVVAVGSSAGADVLGPFAEATGAVLERAVPAEPIDAGVMRQFRRCRESGPIALQVTWPGQDATPILMGVVYPGDAAMVAARLPMHIVGDVVIATSSATLMLRVPLGVRTDAPALRALIGQRQYGAAVRSKREGIAMQYGLLTQETSAVIVKVRADADKADGLPVIVPIPQMVPEGMVVRERQCLRSAASPTGISKHRVVCHGLLGAALGQDASNRDPASQHASADHVQYESNDSDLDIPTFLRKEVDTSYRSPIAHPVADVDTADSGVTSETAQLLFLELYRILFEALLKHRMVLCNLESAVIEMPKEMQEPVRRLLEQCGLKVGAKDANVCARLLIVLNAAMKLDPFTNDQEAILSARRGGPIGAAFGRFLWRFERSRLMKSVVRAIQLK
jgi:Ca-activated chloride channel family protein